MISIRQHSKKYMTVVTLLLCVIFILSSVMTSFAWSDFTQSKTNVFRGSTNTVTVVLRLLEKDADGVISADPVTPIMNAEFQLYRIEPDGSETLVPGGPWYTDANGQIIFDGQDDDHPKLEIGQYVFVETKTAFGYTYDKDDNEDDIIRYEFEITQADVTAGRTVTVPAYNRRGRGTFAVKKTVEGDAPTDAVFTFTVTFSDNGTYTYSVDGGEKVSIASGGTLTLGHGQTALFEDVPVGVQYRVVETAHLDYVISSNGHQGSITEAGSVASFVNTYITEPPTEDEKVKLTVTKKLAGEYPAADKDKEFTFTLIVDGKEQTFTLKPGESKDFEVSGGSQYEIIEDDYFAYKYMQSIINGMGTVGQEDIEVVVTNTFIGEPMVDITGEKTWVLGDNADAVTLPETITVQLKNGDTVVAKKVVRPNAAKEWKYTFTAPKYDAAGKEIKYTVAELPIPSFIPSYKDYDIINTYVPPVSVDPPVVTKVVEGEDAPDTKFAFVMKGQNGAPMPAGAAGNTKTVYITGSGAVEFGSIRFTQAGVYTYDISEVSGGEAGWVYDTAKYSLTFTVAEENGKLVISSRSMKRNGEAASAVRFTNKYTEPPASGSDTVVVAGEKRWVHGSNPTESRPDSITVYVYADGEQVVQSQVTAEDGWKYSFELPQFDADGQKITYTVDEKEINGYKKRIEGYDLINTYIGSTSSTDPTDPADPTDPSNPSSPTDPDDPVDTDISNDVKDPFTPSEPTPDTGDRVNLIFWFVLMAASGTMLLMLLLIRPRRYKGKHCKH